MDRWVTSFSSKRRAQTKRAGALEDSTTRAAVAARAVVKVAKEKVQVVAKVDERLDARLLLLVGLHANLTTPPPAIATQIGLAPYLSI